jgi:hypothetical protein
MDNFFFSNVLFFLPNVHHSFLKLERILTLMILLLLFNLNTFGSKVFLTLNIMDFENALLKKVVVITITRTITNVTFALFFHVLKS